MIVPVCVVLAEPDAGIFRMEDHGLNGAKVLLESDLSGIAAVRGLARELGDVEFVGFDYHQ